MQATRTTERIMQNEKSNDAVHTNGSHGNRCNLHDCTTILEVERSKIMFMSYEEYLSELKLKDNRHNWIGWKMDCYNMSEAEATTASYDPDWGYQKIK